MVDGVNKNTLSMADSKWKLGVLTSISRDVTLLITADRKGPSCGCLGFAKFLRLIFQVQVGFLPTQLIRVSFTVGEFVFKAIKKR